MKSWILCLALVSLVVANQVQVGAARSIDPAVLDQCKLSGAAQDKDANGLPGIPYLSTAQTKATVSSGRSGSSRDQSEDDDATTDNKDPADVKPVQREPARHSRRRKQAHLTELELEAQVSKLRAENSSLLKRSTDIRQKNNEAAVKNRVLKADVETLRAKVNLSSVLFLQLSVPFLQAIFLEPDKSAYLAFARHSPRDFDVQEAAETYYSSNFIRCLCCIFQMKMAEESIKRIAGLNSMFHAVMLELSTMKDGVVLVHDDPNHHFFQPLSDDPLSILDPIVNNGLADISSTEKVQPNSEAAAVAGNKIG
ncbi:hypothetical protein LWI28_004788 [Acer negundo]|uniref:BZIP domain-containing protein n=1 Tax=Acer negundo TaxID=4023 RepID=A0AAD5JP89_ACENE|nr:hypothetical protein LWI28_004788 [Acer negundo]